MIVYESSKNILYKIYIIINTADSSYRVCYNEIGYHWIYDVVF